MQQTVEITFWSVTEPGIMDADRYLSSENAPEIQEDMRLCIASGGRDMILNCTSMTYLTGVGLRAIINIARMMQEVGGKFSVMGLSGQPRALFESCGVDMLIPVIDSL